MLESDDTMGETDEIYQTVHLNWIASIFCSFTLAQSDIKKQPTQKCSDLYRAIGIFTALSHKEWKENKNEKKGAFYVSVAADYSTIYQTICNK